MPQQPTQQAVHIDAILTSISVGYVQSLTAFIAPLVFPIVPVEKQTDKYFIYTKADWFRDEAKLRAGGTESAGSGYGLSTATYSCDVFALHKDVDDQTRKNSDSPLSPDEDATRFVTQRCLLRREIQFVTDYMAGSIWDTTKTGMTDFPKWSDYAASDPVDDIELGKETILQNTGYKPNRLVLGYKTFRKLKHHPDVVDRFKYVSSESITEAMLAQLFGVEKVLVAMAIKNTAAEGATASFAFVAGADDALLCYASPNPGLLAPSAGYIFSGAA